MPLQATSGAASYDAFGGGVAAVPNYIEDVFSTWLIKPSADFTSYSINNGVDLSTKGGMTWFKARDAAQNNLVYDTARGSSSGNANALITNGTQAQQTTFFDYVTPNTNGFTVNYASGGGQLTNSGINYASWTFRKQPKFFDVVTYTGTGSTSTEITHNLGSAPGMVICKKINSTSDWAVWHRGSGGNTDVTGLQLNGTVAAQNNPAGYSTLFTSTTFRPQFVGSSNDNANNVGATYVAYLFAHNAGGFGLTGTDNVISCGSYTSTGNNDINLGYEPQFIIEKRASGVSDWHMWDTMRGMSQTSLYELEANTSAAEVSIGGGYVKPTATGYNNTYWSAGETIIYIAIRRGPMKVPTSGTSVFSPVTWTGNTTSMSGTRSVTGFGKPTDLFIGSERDNIDHHNYAYDRLRGTESGTGGLRLKTQSTNSEASNSPGYGTYSFAQMDGFTLGNYDLNYSTRLYVGWFFGRAPGFFDVVCYTGNGSSLTLNHNLGVAPELIITKSRSNTNSWWTYHVALGNTGYVAVDSTAAAGTGASFWNSTTPSATTFSVSGSLANVWTYTAYLFATCAGVSKVGSYTGTGTTLQVNCGFTGGARFVLIKRTDSTGDWYVWDSARGIVAGNDPYLLLNSTAAEVTSTDYIDTYSAGFEISSTAPAAINASGGTFIFLAIA